MKRPFRLRFFVAFFILSLCLLAFMDWKLFSKSEDLVADELTFVMQDVGGHPFNDITPGSGQIPKTLAAYGVQVDGDIVVAKDEEIVASDIEPAAGRGKFDDERFFEQSLQIDREPVLQTAPAIDFSKPKIAIIIDDIGMDIDGSERAVNLPSPVTIAILPYAERARDFADKAKENGHELIIHTPMEAMNSSVSLGGLALKVSYTDSEFETAFDKMLESFDGYVGINNHMGSRLTQDRAAMSTLMKRLKSENLFFVDSRTIHTSVAAKTADHIGVPFAVRDVFLDHEETNAFVNKALQNVERIAREQGAAIAIGHPKDVTLAGLEQWILQAKQRGFEFVPVSALLQKPEGYDETVQVSDQKIPDLPIPDLSAIAPASGHSQPPQQLRGLY